MNLFAKSLLMTSKKKEQHIINITTTSACTATANDDYSIITVYAVESTNTSRWLYIYFDKASFYDCVQTNDDNIATGIANASSRNGISFKASWTFDYPIEFTFDVVERESRKLVQSFKVIYYTLEAQKEGI